MVPGHEIVGRVVRAGSAVTRHRIGDIVSMGCMVDSCRTCPECRDGCEQFCDHMLPTYAGIEKDGKTLTFGGYSTHIAVDQNFAVKIPSSLSPAAVAHAAEIERGMRNPLVRFMTGIFGRIHMPDWEKEGLALPAPADWSYFKDLLPYDTDQSFIDQVLETVTDAHVNKAWFIGSPLEVAKQMQPFIDAGVDWILPIDYLSLVGDPDDAEAALRRTIDVCAAIKSANPGV